MVNINADKVVGGKRKNGHKMNCGCHICKNMEAKAERNGYQEDIEREKERKNGYQKKNGHKSNCRCPICKNMKNKNTSNVTRKNGKKTNNNKSNGHKSNCGCPICKNMKKKKGGDSDNNARDSDNNGRDSDNNGDGIETEATDKDYYNFNINVGGTRKSRKCNNHKLNCKCPICKNMKKKSITKKRR